MKYLNIIRCKDILKIIFIVKYGIFVDSIMSEQDNLGSIGRFIFKSTGFDCCMLTCYTTFLHFKEKHFV